MSARRIEQTISAMMKVIQSIEWSKHARSAKDLAIAVTPELLELVGTLPGLLASVEQDNDRRERLRIVLDIADLFGEKLKLERLHACWLALEFSGESEAKLVDQLQLAMAYRPENITPDTRAAAKKLLLKSSMVYEPIQPKGMTTTTHEMWFLEGDSPKRRVTTRELPWVQVPEDVREVFIRHGRSRADFTIFKA